MGPWRNWERNSLARKRLGVQVPSVPPPRIARLSDITDDVVHHPSFVEGDPYWSTKRTLIRLFSASCRLNKSRRARTSSLRIEPRGVKSDEIPALWEETTVVLTVVHKRRRGIESVTAGVWRPKSARRERARLGD